MGERDSIEYIYVMRLAFIINSLGDGGAERVVQTLGNYLADNGHEIHIILLDDSVQAYEINKSINIVVLKTSKIARSIGKIAFIPLQSFELNRVLNKLKTDNAISLLTRANLVFSFTKFLSNRTVCISECNQAKEGYKKKNVKNGIMNFLIKKLYRKADLIIPVSDGVKNSLIQDYYLDKSRIKTIYNPQNITALKNHKPTSTNFEFNKKDTYFITLGRLVKQKDHQTMVKAFKKVNEKVKNTKLLILGEGVLRKELQDLIDSLGLTNKIILTGFVKNPFDYLLQADIFVFSSQYEGFGNVLVEAMACGLPVISTDCSSGPAEILDNGQFGMLTKVGDANELAKAMLFMLDDNIYKTYKGKSLVRADDFDVSALSKEYLSIFMDISKTAI